MIRKRKSLVHIRFSIKMALFVYSKGTKIKELNLRVVGANLEEL